MNRQALIKRKVQLEHEREVELRACNAKWGSKISSVDRLLLASYKANDEFLQTATSRTPRTALPVVCLECSTIGDRQKKLMQVVWQTLCRHPGFFTAKSLAEFISESRHGVVSEPDISRLLCCLRKQGVIQLVEKSRGPKPNLYLKL
jgi:hypothetical protein